MGASIFALFESTRAEAERTKATNEIFGFCDVSPGMPGPISSWISSLLIGFHWLADPIGLLIGLPILGRLPGCEAPECEAPLGGPGVDRCPLRFGALGGLPLRWLDVRVAYLKEKVARL